MGKMIQWQRDKRELSRNYAYLVGLVAVAGSEFVLRNILLPARPRGVHIGTAVVMEWLVLLGLVTIWIPRVEGQSLDSIGWDRFKWRYLWLGVLVYIPAMVATSISGVVLESVGLESIRSLQPMLKEYSIPVLLSLFLTGTFLEEVFYRGYLIERVSSLMGRRWLAGFISWLAFTLVHLKFFGLGPTIDASIFSIALTLLYLKERSIWPCVVVHGINNALAYLVFPLVMP